MSVLVLLWFGCAAKDPELLFRAAAQGDAERVEALLDDGARRDAPVDHGLTPLIIAAYAGREEAVRVLLDHGADPNVPNEDQEAPLHTSAAHAAADRIVPMLLASGAEVEARDKWGRTPLAVQAQEGRAGAVDALLTAGADPNARDSEGTTPLLLAAENGHEAVVAALLARGADPRAVNQTGADALIAAAARGYVAIARRLLDAGAVVGAKFNEHDAIGVAITNQQGSPELLAALYGAGPYDRVVGPMGSGLHVAARSGDRAAVDWLLGRGVPVDARHAGFTPLMLAAVTGKVDVARALVAAGADPRADYSGASMLHLAAAYGDPAGVALVLEWGLDVNVLNATGGTPLRSAAEEGHAEVARMLLGRGADPSVVDGFGKRAIDYAREGGHAEVVALLGER